MLAGASAAAAIAAAASTTTALAFLQLVTFGHIWYWYDRIISVYGFSRHGIRVTLYAMVRTCS